MEPSPLNSSTDSIEVAPIIKTRAKDPKRSEVAKRNQAKLREAKQAKKLEEKKIAEEKEEIYRKHKLAEELKKTPEVLAEVKPPAKEITFDDFFSSRSSRDDSEILSLKSEIMELKNSNLKLTKFMERQKLKKKVKAASASASVKVVETQKETKSENNIDVLASRILGDRRK